MITVSVIPKNSKVRKSYLGAGSSSYFYYFQVYLFFLDPSTLFSHHVLVKELYFARFLFFSYMCKINLFTFHSMYKFFIAQIGEWKKFLLVQMMQNHLVFFSFWRSLYVCLFILLHSQWTHVSQVSHWILWWFLATGRLDILQGDLLSFFF